MPPDEGPHLLVAEQRDVVSADLPHFPTEPRDTAALESPRPLQRERIGTAGIRARRVGQALIGDELAQLVENSLGLLDLFVFGA